MVDEREIRKQYSYMASSNLIIEQRHRRTRDAGVAPLDSSAMPGRMGDRSAPKTHTPDLQSRLNDLRRRADSGHPAERLALADVNILDVANEVSLDADGSTYIPTTHVSQRAFEGILTFVMSKLGDQPRDLLRSAADEALNFLKDDRLQENERKAQVETMLGVGMSSDEFSRLALLGRQITDFGEANVNHAIDELEKDALNDVGVAVVFDENDASQPNDEVVDEVVELVEDPDDMDFSADADIPIHQANNPLTNSLVIPDDSVLTPNAIHIDPSKVDGFWLQRQLSEYYSDAHQCQTISEEVFKILSNNEDDHTCENRLVTLLDFDKSDLISMIVENRRVIVFCTRLARAEGLEEKSLIEQEMMGEDNNRKLLELLRLDEGDAEIRHEKGKGKKRARSKTVRFREEQEDAANNVAGTGRKLSQMSLRKLNLESLSFQAGGRLMTVRECKLPDGSEHIQNKDYEEWHVPAIRAVRDKGKEHLISIEQLPQWSQSAFPNIRHLNRMQSAVYPCAFESDENLLLCAPTGAGKTNVATLAILKALKHFIPDGIDTSSLEGVDLSSFKVVYVAPMKALVSEVVENLGKRFRSLCISVNELTGDSSISHQEIARTNVIVTTPEKWDIITRKNGEKAFSNRVQLLIIDEIHLLHDERGPVLEAIVARSLRSAESFMLQTRIVGLSATLPNYKDVASFLRVNPITGMFYFDSSHRPCPLQQCFVGITAKKALTRFQLMNQLTYEKVKVQLQSSNQVIIFVHSRKETASTCRFLIEKAIEEEIIDQFLKSGTASHEIIQEELLSIVEKDLSSILEHGLGIHHAGMVRSDRQRVEALFEAGHIKVLVSTATLAWGVNLPAHAVIIKGTQVYSPEHGRWIELSPMDVMQMMGRAGRPQFDTFGEGHIITTKADVLYYLSMLNDQLPIESQFVSRLADMLNAEIAMGTVSSIVEGSKWLSYTYLYVRMLKNPTLYGIAVDEHQSDVRLERRRCELVLAAVMELQRTGLVTYNSDTEEIDGTELGGVAADFYVTHQSMSVYVENMKSSTTDVDLLRVFSLSGEFRHMRVRDEEKLELLRLAERVPIPIKESLEEPTAKVNVLLQAYISNLSLDGLALKADMVYVTQSAARLTRALLRIAMLKKWAQLTYKCLSLCKAVSSRQWNSQSPLRQFSGHVNQDVIHKIERKDIPFERYYDFSVAELGELLRNPKLGRTAHRLVHSLPRLQLEAHMRPLSRSMIEIDLSLMSDFRFDKKIHRSGEAFWIIVEDGDSERILHYEEFFLRPAVSTEEHTLSITIQLTSPQSPQYFIRCLSDRWISPEVVLPLSFRNLLLPEKFPACSKFLEMRPLSVEKAFVVEEGARTDDGIVDELAHREAFAEIHKYFRSCFKHFTSIQTQLFQCLFESNLNTVCATLPDVERDVCGELCVARLFSRKPASVAIWIVGRGEIAVDHVHRWLSEGIGKCLNLNVGKFISDRNEDLAMLRTSGSLIVTTAERWDMFSRKWRQKKEGKIFKKIGLIILDGIHFLSRQGGSGAALETIGSRMRYIASDASESGLEPFRIIALSDPVANAKEIGHWLGSPPSAVFSFNRSAVDKKLKISVVSGAFRERDKGSAVLPLSRHVFTAIRKYCGDSKFPVVVFVPSSKVARNLAIELVGTAGQGGTLGRFSNVMESNTKSLVDKIESRSLKECLEVGIGFIHNRLTKNDEAILLQLFREGGCHLLIAAAQYAWEVKQLKARLVVVAGTSQEGDRFATRRAEYDISDVLRMMSITREVHGTQEKRIGVIVTEAALQNHYEQYLDNSLAVESQLWESFSDHLNAEIASGVVETKQDAVDYLTWTFYYRRLPKNPNYYGMKELSHAEISKHLSEMVEGALGELGASKCVATEGEDDVALGTLNLGIIAAHYYVRHATVELFASSLTPKTRQKGLLDIVCMAAEFGDVPVRIGEEETLKALASSLPVTLEDYDGVGSYSIGQWKTRVILHAQLHRRNLSGALREDQAKMVPLCVRLLKAMVDIISSAGWLKPALAAVELSTWVIQGLCDSKYQLMQLPHIDRRAAVMLHEQYNVLDIFDFSEMGDKEKLEALKGFKNEQILEIASAYGQIPSLKDIEILSVEERIDNDGVSNTRVVVEVKRNEEDDEEEENGQDRIGKVPLVCAPRYPEAKEEGWWVMIGDEENNALLTLKHMALKEKAVVKLDFPSPSKAGKHNLKLYLLSDSYIECDQDEIFECSVSAAVGATDEVVEMDGAKNGGDVE